MANTTMYSWKQCTPFPCKKDNYISQPRLQIGMAIPLCSRKMKVSTSRAGPWKPPKVSLTLLSAWCQSACRTWGPHADNGRDLRRKGPWVITLRNVSLTSGALSGIVQALEQFQQVWANINVGVVCYNRTLTNKHAVQYPGSVTLLLQSPLSEKISFDIVIILDSA